MKKHPLYNIMIRTIKLQNANNEELDIFFKDIFQQASLIDFETLGVFKKDIESLVNKSIKSIDGFMRINKYTFYGKPNDAIPNELIYAYFWNCKTKEMWEFLYKALRKQEIPQFDKSIKGMVLKELYKSHKKRDDVILLDSVEDIAANSHFDYSDVLNVVYSLEQEHLLETCYFFDSKEVSMCITEMGKIVATGILDRLYLDRL